MTIKAGVRALGVAESYEESDSTLAGAVVRADRVVDDIGFGRCTVGGTDATEAVASLVDRVGRPDVRYVLIAGVAPAWYNVLDLETVAAESDCPVLSVSFEGSEGLEEPLRAAFEGDALKRRLETYRAQPARRPVTVGDDETVYVRSVGVDDTEAAEVVRAFTPEGGRPEPLRVARLAARGADAYARELADGE
jgi:endonuclease V-like protein UPF0215 family